MSVTRTVTVRIPSGIHARPAADFVATAKRFSSDLSLEAKGRKGNCKSLVSLLKLGVGQGTAVAITADGLDEAEAIEALVALLDPDGADGSGGHS
ncbi:HPr family phosphocarrier protein [Microbispora sp. H11081]|uniref:HPr family phosphocarrier protein n=1 Tax=Microbispora sp. H11081 TaxID=2729107 RepID=UPI001473FD8F|nr:HPr family phosphocarrier protein [Microbispora sp. H11081]